MQKALECQEVLVTKRIISYNLRRVHPGYLLLNCNRVRFVPTPEPGPVRGEFTVKLCKFVHGA